MLGWGISNPEPVNNDWLLKRLLLIEMFFGKNIGQGRLEYPGVDRLNVCNSCWIKGIVGLSKEKGNKFCPQN